MVSRMSYPIQDPPFVEAVGSLLSCKTEEYRYNCGKPPPTTLMEELGGKFNFVSTVVGNVWVAQVGRGNDWAAAVHVVGNEVVGGKEKVVVVAVAVRLVQVVVVVVVAAAVFGMSCYKYKYLHSSYWYSHFTTHTCHVPVCS